MARNKMTQIEMVARYLAARFNQWVAGHELVKSASSVIGDDYIIQDADTRGYDLVRDGYDSDLYHYTFTSEKRGKYTYFKCIGKEKLGATANDCNYGTTPTTQYPTPENLQIAREAIKAFEEYQAV